MASLCLEPVQSAVKSATEVRLGLSARSLFFFFLRDYFGISSSDFTGENRYRSKACIPLYEQSIMVPYPFGY